MEPTPLLDRLTPLPAPVPPGRGSWIATAATLVAVVLAVAVFAAKPAWARAVLAAVNGRFPDLLAGEWPPTRIAAAVASAAFTMVVLVALHEGGHVVAGLLAGFRFKTIAVGPLKIDDRFRVSVHRGTLQWSGGWVQMLPASGDRLRWRALILVAGGPAASLTAAALALRFAGGGVGSALFVAGSLAGLADLLPMRSGAITFDGLRIVHLLRDDAWSRRWLALMRVAAEFRDGVAPDELPAERIEDLVAVQDQSADTSVAHAVAYGAAFFAGDDERAAALLETSLRSSGHAPAPFRMALMSDAAAFQGRRRHRPDLAMAWRSDLPPDAPAWLQARSEAAVLQAQGRIAAAAAKLDECEQAMRGLPMPSEEQRSMAIRLLGRWKAELAGVS